MNNTKSIVAAFRSDPNTTVPNAPGNLAATAQSESQIALAWSDNSSNETGFRLERSANGGAWTEFALTNSNIVNFNDTGLVAATTYQYRVRSYNSSGNSVYSNIGSATTGTQPVAVCTNNAPAVTLAPSSVYSKTSATINFNISLTNQDASACGISTFVLTGDNGTVISSYSLSPAGSVTATWTVTAPTTDGSYIKSVTATSAGHSNGAASATVIVDGTAPSAPGNLAASVVRKSQVKLSWSASTDTGSGVDHYDISRNGTKVQPRPASVLPINRTLKESVNYTVQAFDKAGNSIGSSKTVTL